MGNIREWLKHHYNNMLPRGSTRRATGPRTGIRNRRSAANSVVSNSPHNNNSLQKDILSEFREASINKYAEGVGITQNGTNNEGFSITQNGTNTNGMKVDENKSTPQSNVIAGRCAPGQSISVESGSAGSPSRGSDAAIATPARNNHMTRVQHLDIHQEELDSPETAGTRKRKRVPRVNGGEKGGRGLRQFSMKVSQKVESKGRTTYNEVADELVAEYANLDRTLVSPDRQQYDEKNIRRRVYDALNVLMAMEIISKEKKEIQWKGLPKTSINDAEQLKAEKLLLKSRIEKKASYFQELKEQLVGLQNLVKRNEHMYSSGNTPSGGVSLPFILVQTHPRATVEIEISEDMQLVHFDFNSTPFGLHDDAYVLKEMNFCERPFSTGADSGQEDCCNGAGLAESKSPVSNMCQHLIPYHSPLPTVGASYPMSSTPGRTCPSPPVPGILKARVKHENMT